MWATPCHVSHSSQTSCYPGQKKKKKTKKHAFIEWVCTACHNIIKAKVGRKKTCKICLQQLKYMKAWRVSLQHGLSVFNTNNACHEIGSISQVCLTGYVRKSYAHVKSCHRKGPIFIFVLFPAWLKAIILSQRTISLISKALNDCGSRIPNARQQSLKSHLVLPPCGCE